MGVYSQSSAAPIKQDNFLPRDATFKGAPTYQEWRFFYEPLPGAAGNPTPIPGSPPAAAAIPGNAVAPASPR
jgi:hypothetical protein